MFCENIAYMNDGLTTNFVKISLTTVIQHWGKMIHFPFTNYFNLLTLV